MCGVVPPPLAGNSFPSLSYLRRGTSSPAREVARADTFQENPLESAFPAFFLVCFFFFAESWFTCSPFLHPSIKTPRTPSPLPLFPAHGYHFFPLLPAGLSFRSSYPSLSTKLDPVFAGSAGLLTYHPPPVGRSFPFSSHPGAFPPLTSRCHRLTSSEPFLPQWTRELGSPPSDSSFSPLSSSAP